MTARRSDSSGILDAVAAYYSGKLVEHGVTAKGVDWKDAASHDLRHRQFLRLLENDLDASVLDVGCGYGNFLSFLRAAGHRGAYIGCDVAPAMIEVARNLHGEGPDRRFLVGSAPEDAADYAIGSGILNVIRGAARQAWAAHAATTIAALHAAGRRGFGFNMLSSNSDPEKRRPDLYYADPVATLAASIERYGRHVALLQDYGLWEFTLLVRQPSFQTANPKRHLP